jgi:polysaccharide biosynthesis transport protein
MPSPPHDPRSDASSSSLVQGVGVLRERWWFVAIGVAACTLAALALSLSATKKYSATSSLLIGSTSANLNALVDANAGSASDPQRDQATALLLVTSGSVAERVQKALKLGGSPSDLTAEVSAASSPDANLIDITATDPDPVRARNLANAFAEQYVSYRRESDLAVLEQGQRLLEQRRDQLPPDAAGQRSTIDQAIQRVIAQQGATTGGAQVVDKADTPSVPSSPRTKRNVALGILLGLVLGLGLAFGVDLFDRRVKTVEDFELLYGLRALSTVPEQTRNPVNQRERAAALEPFRILRNGLDFLTVGGEVHVVLVTSAVPGEGKSTVAAGLARAVALSGQRVALVETDLRRPTFHDQFNLGGDPRGLTTALVGGVPPTELLRTVLAGLPTLRVLPSGPVPPNSAELLRSAEMSTLLERLVEDSDLIILDAPPLLPVADTHVLLDLPQVDAALVVGRAFKTSRDDIARCRAVLDRRRQHNVGLVINGLRNAESNYDYYGTIDEAGMPRVREKT